MSGGVSTERARAETFLAYAEADNPTDGGSRAIQMARDVLSLVDKLEAAEGAYANADSLLVAAETRAETYERANDTSIEVADSLAGRVERLEEALRATTEDLKQALYEDALAPSDYIDARIAGNEEILSAVLLHPEEEK